MKRALVNDMLSALPGHRTFWNDLMDWFGMEFVGGDFAMLCGVAEQSCENVSLIIRNATYFGPLEASEHVPTISLLQDIMEDGPQREMQEAVIKSSAAIVYNSKFTESKYPLDSSGEVRWGYTIPLPVDFATFEPGNPMGLQQALSLPDGCVCWIGSQHPVKGWDIYLAIARHNPDIPFVAVFKDALPEYLPPNIRAFVRVTHEELARIIGACRIGICTSRMESQHLAGIEMGACGLPMVAPPVGTYFEREDMPGVLVKEPTPENFTEAIRMCLIRICSGQLGDLEATRKYWRKEFDRPIIMEAWKKLIEEVEG